MFRVRVQYNPRLTGAEKRLLATGDRLGKLRLVMQGPLRDAVNHLIRRQFETQGAAYGQKWKALAPSTVLAKLRAGVVDRGILVFSGAMRAGMLRFRPSDSRLRALAGNLRLDLNVGVFPYPFHHLGTKRGLPQRQVLPSPVPLSFRREVRALFRNFILSGSLTYARGGNG